MSEKIYADPAEPSTLIYGDKSLRCATLQEAVLEWMRLPQYHKDNAKIKTDGGMVYDAIQIDSLHVR